MKPIVFVCPHVFSAAKPVLLIGCDERDLQLLCGDVHDGLPQMIHLAHLLERDASLGDVVARLKPGYQAERPSIDEPWQITEWDGQG